MNDVETIKPNNLKIKEQVPTIAGIRTITPNILEADTQISNNFYIENTFSAFGTSNLTYNEPNIIYNNLGDIYGGAGATLSGAIPHLFSIGIIDTSTEKVYQAGQPMGLLLTVTYPTGGTVS